MKSRYPSYGAAVAATLAMVLLVFVAVPHAQQANPRQAAAAAKPTPKMADGHPDFTGFWLNGAAGLSNYAGTEGEADDGNLKRLPDGSLLWLYGGPVAGVPNEGPVNNAVPANAPPYKPEYLALASILFSITFLTSFNDTEPPRYPFGTTIIEGSPCLLPPIQLDKL